MGDVRYPIYATHIVPREDAVYVRGSVPGKLAIALNDEVYGALKGGDRFEEHMETICERGVNGLSIFDIPEESRTRDDTEILGILKNYGIGSELGRQSWPEPD